MVTAELLVKKSMRFSSFWTFIFCSVWFWIPVQGQYRLIGSDQPIIAAPGDDVILPCHVHPDRNMEASTVEWSRPDLQNLPSDRRRGVDYVFMYRFRKEDRDMMMASYVHRTSLSADGLKHGDASLRIRNVTLEDNGRFRCFIPNLRREAEVLLSVDPNIRTSTTETPQLDRNLVTAEPENGSSGDVSARRSRILLLLPVFFFFFFICFSSIFIFYIKNDFGKKKFQTTLQQSSHTETLRPSGTIRESHG